MRSADEILDHLARALGCINDSELADRMGVPRSTLGSWRQRGSTPFAKCITLSEQSGVDLNELFLGEPITVAEGGGTYPSDVAFETALRRMRAATEIVEAALKTLGDAHIEIDVPAFVQLVYRYGIDEPGAVEVATLIRGAVESGRRNKGG